MELLHREIDVVPGQQPYAPTPDGRRADPGLGSSRPVTASGIIRLKNETNNENAFKVSVRGDGNPYWQSDWYLLEPAAPIGGAGDAANIRCDDHGKGWVKVFVPRGGIRDVHLKFRLMMRPDSRAGTYPFKVIVEPDIAPGQTVAPPPIEIEGKLYVHPYNKWSMTIEPEEAHVTRRRRKSEVAAVIKNESNDWLYCDLIFPKGQGYFGEARTARVAIPPPESRQTETIRRVPLALESKLKDWRGLAMPSPVTMQAVRVHAPSVSPIPSSQNLTGMENGAVVATDAPQDSYRTAQGTASLVYHPAIPSSIADFPKWIFANAKGLVVAAIGLYAALYLLLISLNLGLTQKITTTSLDKDGWITVAADKMAVPFEWRLANSKFYAAIEPAKERGDQVDAEPVSDTKLGVPAAVGSPASVPSVFGVDDKNRLKARLNLKKYDGQSVQITVHRGGWFPWFPIWGEAAKIHNVAIGTPQKKEEETPAPQMTAGVIENGKVRIAVSGKPLPAAPEEVLVNGKPVAATMEGSKRAFTVPIPDDAPSPVTISVSMKKGGAAATFNAQAATPAIVPAPPPPGPSEQPAPGGGAPGPLLPDPNGGGPAGSASKAAPSVGDDPTLQGPGTSPSGSDMVGVDNGTVAGKVTEEDIIAKMRTAYEKGKKPVEADTPLREAEGYASDYPNSLVAQSAVAFICARLVNDHDAPFKKKAEKALEKAKKLMERDSDKEEDHQALYYAAEAAYLSLLKNREQDIADSLAEARKLDKNGLIGNLIP